jgi:hypothetical protein
MAASGWHRSHKWKKVSFDRGFAFQEQPMSNLSKPAAIFAIAALSTTGLAYAQTEPAPTTIAQAPVGTVPPPTIDSNEDGKADAWDRDANGVPDAWDVNGDGKPDKFDDDGDGKPDDKAMKKKEDKPEQ